MGFLKRILGGRRSEPPVDRVRPDDRGVFAGLFVADLHQLERWNLKGLTPSDWPAVEFKWLETVKLGTLEAILTHRPYDDIVQEQLHDIVRDGGAEGPWVTAVRGELIAALSELTPEHAGSVAEAWADTDEFKASPTDRPSSRDIADFAQRLNEIAALAKRSRQDGKPVYLLMGL